MAAVNPTDVIDYPIEHVWLCFKNARDIESDDDPRLDSIAESIRKHGVLEPILVRPIRELRYGIPDKDGTDHGWLRCEIIAGERRFRAARRVFGPQGKIPCRAMDGLSDEEAAEIRVVENLERQDLAPLEEAAAVAQLVGEGWDVERIADRLGRPRMWVALRARLATLTEGWRKRFAEDLFADWTAVQMAIIARLEPHAQDALLEESKHWYGMEGWTASQLARQIENWTRTLASAPWDLADALLLPKRGSCTDCTMRSSCRPGLFPEDEVPEVAKVDRCLDATCWNAKLDAHVARQEQALRAEHPDLVLISTSHVPAKGVLDPRGYVDCNRKTKLSVPAMVADGPQRGELRWVEVTGKPAPGNADVPSAKPAQKPKTAKTVADRRAELDGRRKKLAVEKLFDWLQQDNSIRELVTGDRPVWSDECLVALATWLGCGPGEDSDWQNFKHVTKRQRLARRLLQSLRKRWEDQSRRSGLDELWPEVESVACDTGLASYLGACIAAANEELAEPESWQRMEAEEREAAKAATPDRRARASGDTDATVGSPGNADVRSAAKGKPKPTGRRRSQGKAKAGAAR